MQDRRDNKPVKTLNEPGPVTSLLMWLGKKDVCKDSQRTVPLAERKRKDCPWESQKKPATLQVLR
jgi:hypothetical protein